MFADADDYFTDFFFWENISDEEKENNDLFAFQFYVEDNMEVVQDYDIWMFAKIYKTCHIKNNNLKFINSYCNEDVVFNFAYLGFINNIYLGEPTIYFWYSRENSLSRQEDYLYHSTETVAKEILKIFKKHKENFIQDKIPGIIINRMMRFFNDINDALLLYPDLFTNKKHRKALHGLRMFYRECYRPYESLFTKEEIVSVFNTLVLSSKIKRNIFQSIDYFSFIEKLKETP